MRSLAFIAGAALGVLALSGCASPQIVQATDCRGAAVPCGIVVVDHTQAMSNLPITVPVSAVPSLP